MPAEIVGHRLALLGPLGEHGQIVEPALQRFAEIAVFLEPPAALQQLLRGRLVLPEIRGADALFDFLQFVGGSCGVKDSSAGRSAAREILIPAKLFVQLEAKHGTPEW